MEKWIGKQTWIGLVTALILLLAGIAIGAFLLEQDVLSPQSQAFYLTVVTGCSAFTGAFIGAKGNDHHLLHALIVCALLYLLFWAATLCSDCAVVFDKGAIQKTGAIWGGGILASLLIPRKKKPTRAAKRKGKQGHKRGSSW